LGSVIGIATIPPFPDSMTCPRLRALPSTVISCLFSTTALSDSRGGPTYQSPETGFTPVSKLNLRGLRCYHIRTLCAGHRHSPGGLDRLYLLIIASYNR
jgi:hypothetical protein